MSIEPTLLAFAGVVAVGYLVQTVAGFGALLVCVTLGALLFDIQTALTIGVPLSLVQTALIVWRHRDEVRWRLLGTRILPLMGLGLVTGLVAVAQLGYGTWLQPALGVLVFALASRELVLIARRRGAPVPGGSIHPAASTAAMLGAGVVHSIFGTGGPLLVYALGKSDLSKGEIRSTLSAVWPVLNIVIVANFARAGRYDAEALWSIVVTAPAMFLGMFAGEWLHDRVNESRFRIGMFSLLLVASVTLIARA